MILEYELQFFAEGPSGDKTEEPTDKKLEDSRKEGQVAKSKEIANCVGLFSVFVLLKLYVRTIGNSFLNLFSYIYSRIADSVVFWNGYAPSTDIFAILKEAVIQIIVMCAPFFIVGFMVAFLCDLLQVKWKPTAKPLKPKLSRISPASGFKRIFSMNSLMELIKSIAKILVIVFISYSYLKERWGLILQFYELPLRQCLGLTLSLVTDLGIRISAVYLIVAFSDFAYQKWKFHKDMMMTKQEVKDEYKNSEGDPQVKGRIRQRMQEASRRRMMQDLPKADVVITNPTHFAVAIQYDPEISEAPIVLAKGQDYMAQRIKSVAKDHHIEIVENKPLARMLYHNVDIGQAIPPELYQAVAEVLAFVYHLQGRV